jgi:general secretion pathway protein J
MQRRTTGSLGNPTGRMRRAEGFTLLEIIVVLAVFGFLLVGLSQTVRFGVTAWRQQVRLSEGKTDLDGVDRSLRSIIENLVPSDEAGRPTMVGAASSLTGLTTMRPPGSGLTPIRIEAGLAISGTRLVLRWRPYHHGDPLRPLSPPIETELASNVTRLQLMYQLPSGGWAASWTNPYLPLLIRVRLTFSGESGERWPDIVAAPLLSGS